jgi:hypothetical protein
LHQHLSELLLQRVVALPEVHGLARDLWRIELQAWVALDGLRAHLLDHIGEKRSGRIGMERVLQIRLATAGGSGERAGAIGLLQLLLHDFGHVLHRLLVALKNLLVTIIHVSPRVSDGRIFRDVTDLLNWSSLVQFRL